MITLPPSSRSPALQKSLTVSARNSKANARLSARTRHDRGVHSDQLPRPINERAARTARIERSVRLNKARIDARRLLLAAPETRRSKPEIIPGRYRRSKSVWIADRQNEITHARSAAGRERKGRERIGFNSQHG